MLRMLILTTCLCGGTEAKEQPKNGPMDGLLKLSPAEFIQRFDKNKDGFLQKDELPERLANNFEKMDRNRDGKLDLAEVGQVLNILRAQANQVPFGGDPDKMVEFIFNTMDTNKDDKISRAEAKNRMAENFDMIDTNKDDFLDRKEVTVMAQRFMKAMKAGGLNQETKRGGPDFDALDSNADGRLSREELKGTPFQQPFDEIDTDRNGTIDRREFENYLKREKN